MGLNKIDLMHEMFGKDPEHKCAECKNLSSYTESKNGISVRAMETHLLRLRTGD